MLNGFIPVFVADTKLIYGCKFVAPLRCNLARAKKQFVKCYIKPLP